MDIITLNTFSILNTLTQTLTHIWRTQKKRYTRLKEQERSSTQTFINTPHEHVNTRGPALTLVSLDGDHRQQVLSCQEYMRMKKNVAEYKG